MIKGKTSSGFNFEADERIVKDYYFVELLAKVTGGDADEAEIFTDSADMMERVLTKKGKEALIKHVRKDGISDVDDVYREFGEILTAIKAEDDEAKK